MGLKGRKIKFRVKLKIVRFEVSTAVTMTIIISQKMIIIKLKIVYTYVEQTGITVFSDR
jgi:hypothetical protein